MKTYWSETLKRRVTIPEPENPEDWATRDRA